MIICDDMVMGHSPERKPSFIKKYISSTLDFGLRLVVLPILFSLRIQVPV